MLRLSFSNMTRTADLDVARGQRRKIWQEMFWPTVLVLAIGAVIATGIAWFIAREAWPFVIGLSFLIPIVILFTRYPFAGLIIWMLVMPFLQTTVNSLYRHSYWIFHRAMPPVALAVVVLASLLKVARRPPVKLGWADLAMVMFVGWTAVSIFWFQPQPVPYLYLLYDRVLIPTCLYFLVRLVAPGEADLKRLVPVAFLIVMVESIVGLLSWFAPQVLPREWLGYQGTRTVGTLGYMHAYTTTLVFFSALLFHDAMQRKPGLIRSMFLIAFGLGAVGVFFSFSRGSWLGGLVATAGLLIRYPKPMLRLLVLVTVVMVVLGSGLLAEQMAFAQKRMESESTANDRLVIWDAGMQMIQARPFGGWGYGDYSRYAGQFQRRVYNYVAAYAHASHNSYIAIAAELGVPALLIFFFPVLWYLGLTFKVWPRMPKAGFWSQSLLLAFWMVILDHVIVNGFSDMRFSTYGMGMWWIALGLLANMVHSYLQPGDMSLPGWVRRANAVDR